MKEFQNKKIVILLAEDDPDDSMLFIQAVEELKIPSEIHVMPDGLKLINKLSDGKAPDIIFLDMNMPLKNGLECLEFIRSLVNLKDTPVIIYSTSRNNTEIKACFDNGANCYVVKPYTFEAIVKMVDTFCQKSRQIIKPSTLQEFVVAFE